MKRRRIAVILGVLASVLVAFVAQARLNNNTNLVPPVVVTSIIAGTNVTISPVGGTGAVTVNASGGGGGSAVINAATVTLTSAQIKALDLTPVTIVAAPGAGKAIALVGQPFVQYKFGTIRYATHATSADPQLAFNTQVVNAVSDLNAAFAGDQVTQFIFAGTSSVNTMFALTPTATPAAVVANQPLILGIVQGASPASYNCGPITALTVANGGAGYNPGDTFTIDAGFTLSDSGDATGHVLTAPGGVVGTVAINAAGTSYLFTTANAGSGPYPTAHTSGTGNNALTVNVTGVTAGDGTAVVTVLYQVVTLQ